MLVMLSAKTGWEWEVRTWVAVSNFGRNWSRNRIVKMAGYPANRNRNRIIGTSLARTIPFEPEEDILYTHYDIA